MKMMEKIEPIEPIESVPDDLPLQPTRIMPGIDPDDLALYSTRVMPVMEPERMEEPESSITEQETKKWQFRIPFSKQAIAVNVPGTPGKRTSVSSLESHQDYDWSIALAPTMLMPVPAPMEDIALAPTLLMPIPASMEEMTLAATQIMPAIVKQDISESAISQPGNNVEALRKLLKSSGIYALASVATPLITLGLSPFLARHLTPSDYGAFTIINTFVSLMAGVTQLGLGSAFFRAYSYDYSGEKERRDVLATVSTLLSITSLATVAIMCLSASWLSTLLFGQETYRNVIYLGAGIVLLQNLAIPGFSWLRAENRPFVYSLLSIGNLLVSLFTNILCIGVLSMGLTGAVLGIGSGYIFVVLCTLPVIVLRAGVKIRPDIARGLLSFGVPLVLSVISYWALQVLDRYLLTIFGSLAQTSEYAVAYTLGSALSIVVISPFTLAWPTAMFTIAKRKDAERVFQGVFRLFGFFLLFAAFGLSLMGKLLLYWLYPPVYHTAEFVIPVVAGSLVFYGLYYIVNIGLNVKRKTWLLSLFPTIAAIINLALNLVLIPRYGAMGAAIATLLAYIVLTLVAYLVNQRFYPLPFEIGKFVLAFLLGVVLYQGSDVLSRSYAADVGIVLSASICLLYGAILALVGLLPLWRHVGLRFIDLHPTHIHRANR